MRHHIVFNENNARRALAERLLLTYMRPLHATDGDSVLTRGPRARETRVKIRRTINYKIVLIIGRSAIATRVGGLVVLPRKDESTGEWRMNVVFGPIMLPSFHPYFLASAPRLQQILIDLKNDRNDRLFVPDAKSSRQNRGKVDYLEKIR